MLLHVQAPLESAENLLGNNTVRLGLAQPCFAGAAYFGPCYLYGRALDGYDLCTYVWAFNVLGFK